MKHLRLFTSLLAAAALAFIATPAALAVDYTVTAANVTKGTGATVINSYLSGAAITAGQAVYLDTNNAWQLADANGASALRQATGIALNSAPGSGQPLSVIQGGDDFTPGFTISANTVVILSATAGGLAPIADITTGWYGNIIGVGCGSNKIKLIFKYTAQAN